jgi:hypothetical protein
LASDVRNPKCYADVLDRCSPKISGEHPQSDGVLREVESPEGGVYVSGHKWLRGEKRRIGIKSLVGKVLCTSHNALLSPLDEEARRFVRLSEPFFGDTEVDETVNGTLLERYLLGVKPRVCKSFANRMRSTIAGANSRYPEAVR